MRFFLYTGNQISQKLESNEIFNDFAISWDPINEIDSEFFLF